MTTKIETAPIKVRDSAYETTSILGWGWPDEAALADFAERDVRAEQDVRVAQDARAEMAQRTEQPDRLLKNTAEYAALYFVS